MNDYQEQARKTAVYPMVWHKVVYPTLKLNGEAGEVAELVGKMFRDDGGELTEDRRTRLLLELGDVLWYIAAIASDLDVSLSTIAKMNIDKLQKRRAAGRIHGEGSDR